MVNSVSTRAMLAAVNFLSFIISKPPRFRRKRRVRNALRRFVCFSFFQTLRLAPRHVHVSEK